jgi:hypothetical protein
VAWYYPRRSLQEAHTGLGDPGLGTDCSPVRKIKVVTSGMSHSVEVHDRFLQKFYGTFTVAL